MWAAYAKDGVVLKSTFGRLVGALPSNCRVGPVQYVDFSKQLVTEGLQDWHKRHYFRNEREVRARFQDVPAGANSLPDLTKSHPEKGRLVKVDPNVFLTAIVCRPYALLEELERVRRDCVQVGIAVPVQPSTMSGVPKLV